MGFAWFVLFILIFFFNVHLGNVDEDTKGILCHIYNICFLAAKIFTQFLEVLNLILNCEEKETHSRCKIISSGEFYTCEYTFKEYIVRAVQN